MVMLVAALANSPLPVAAELILAPWKITEPLAAETEGAAE